MNDRNDSMPPGALYVSPCQEHDALDEINQAVARITDEEIENRLSETLCRAKAAERSHEGDGLVSSTAAWNSTDLA